MHLDSFPFPTDFFVLQVEVPLGLNSGPIQNLIPVEY